MNFAALPSYPPHDEVDASQVAEHCNDVEVIWPPAAMTIAFMATAAIGFGTTVLVVWSIPPKIPNPTEAYEGIADFVDALKGLGIGAILSIIAGFVAAVIAGVWAERRNGRRTNRPT